MVYICTSSNEIRTLKELGIILTTESRKPASSVSLDSKNSSSSNDWNGAVFKLDCTHSTST